MKIQYDPKKIENFNQVIMAHDFNAYFGLTKAYKGFEVPNLKKEMTIKLLEKLNPSNQDTVIGFGDFWNWYKKELGQETVDIWASYIYPSKGVNYEKTVSDMMSDHGHEWWDHIKARVYKKWCSIMTETQCVYAMLKYIDENNKDWEIVSSPMLDSIGVDFIVITNVATPIQIKMLSHSRIAMSKKNNDENLSREYLKDHKIKKINAELEVLNINKNIAPSVLVKYGLKERNGEFPFPYLKEHGNGFVYFDEQILMKQLSRFVNQKQSRSIKQ